MDVARQQQLNPVADEMQALNAAVRPILKTTLYTLNRARVDRLGGYENVSLWDLARDVRESDGDAGNCFEYAVHDALNNHNTDVLSRLETAARLCKVQGTLPASILTTFDKSGDLELVETAQNILTAESRLLTGRQGTVKLRDRLYDLPKALRSERARERLPTSIRGLWKADLFFGFTDTDRWLGTTVKINPRGLEAAPGLRIGIVPATEGFSDRVRFDRRKNLVICPLLWDGNFMQVFWGAFNIVKAVIKRDAQMPTLAQIYRPAERQVASFLVERRNIHVVDIIEGLDTFAQPELLLTEDRHAASQLLKGKENRVRMIAPISRTIGPLDRRPIIKRPRLQAFGSWLSARLWKSYSSQNRIRTKPLFLQLPPVLSQFQSF